MDDRRPIREMVKEAVEMQGGVATSAEIRHYITRKYGDVNPASINPHINMCSVNSPSRIQYPTNRKPRVANDPRYDFLFHTGRGSVELYDPVKHGIWEVRQGEHGGLVAARMDPTPSLALQATDSPNNAGTTKSSIPVDHRTLSQPRTRATPEERSDPAKVPDLTEALKHLSTTRPVFHSEADFQHALAWEIHERWPESSIRLEFKPPHLGSAIYLDIWATIGQSILAIELKYKTRGGHLEVAEEQFDLLNQGAQPLARYDFLKDVERLERVVEGRPDITGWAILLTNDSMYWNPPKGGQTGDASFRIHEGATIGGELRWGEEYAASTIRKREAVLNVRGAYPALWQDYSVVTGPPHTRFRHLTVKIP